MVLDSRRLSVLRKVVDLGFEDEKAICSITSEQLLSSCKSIQEARDIVALQKAIKNNTLVVYLTGKGDEK